MQNLRVSLLVSSRELCFSDLWHSLCTLRRKRCTPSIPFSLHGLTASNGPRNISTRRRGVCPISIDNYIWIHYISNTFRHFVTIFTQYKTLMKKLSVGFGIGENTFVVKESVPETGIKQVKNSMFSSTNVKVGTSPVGFLLFIYQIVRVYRDQCIVGDTSRILAH